MGRGVSAVVVLDAPRGTLRVDLARVRVQRKSLLEIAGVIGLPPGLHRVEVNDGERGAALWLQVEPGRLVVKAWDAGLLVDPDPFRTAQVQGLAAEEGLAEHLAAYPAGANAPWPALVAPLERLGPAGARLHKRDPDGFAAPLEAALEGTHGGRAPALLGELAQAFLAGFVDEDEAAQERWRHLARAVLTGADLVGAHPQLFDEATALLVAQLQLLPVELSPDAACADDARRLAEAFAAHPHLAAAGQRLQEHLAQRGLG
ncbi:MAG: hypothetical protein M9894_30600 [Planctomycetes bacterium]|nr:hypothetical protein [Planctomycetota bacterium]